LANLQLGKLLYQHMVDEDAASARFPQEDAIGRGTGCGATIDRITAASSANRALPALQVVRSL
jgi:hypothetical protein